MKSNQELKNSHGFKNSNRTMRRLKHSESGLTTPSQILAIASNNEIASWPSFLMPKLRKTEDAVKQSRKQAARLAEKLKTDFDEIGSRETDNKITRIKERNEEAGDQIRKDWKKRVVDELKPLLPLVDIVREATLLGHEGISESVAAIKAQEESPPETMEAAVNMRQSLSFLRESLSNLDLEGPGGEFLKKAVKGKASAKDLLKEEVQSFLNDKDLWDILTINVG